MGERGGSGRYKFVSNAHKKHMKDQCDGYQNRMNSINRSVGNLRQERVALCKQGMLREQKSTG